MIDSTPDHSKISPTAKIVAYWRQFSDIPFAHEVAKMVRADEIFKTFLEDSHWVVEDISWFAMMIEARYKSMVNAIRRENIKQVLELASGVSLRGFAMTSDPEMIYVETDLPEISSEKIAIIQSIREKKNIPERANLFFNELNVLNLIEFEKATRPFLASSPIAIIHEGLFQYLSIEEKRLAATHIHIVLERFGGVWLTPDLTTKSDIDMRQHPSATMKKITENVQKTTQRDFRELAFENETHIQEFFNELGFKIQESSQIDNTFALTSVKKLNISQDIVNSYSNNLKIWSLRVK